MAENPKYPVSYRDIKKNERIDSFFRKLEKNKDEEKIK